MRRNTALTARLLDGRPLSQAIQEQLAEAIRDMRASVPDFRPCMAVVLVGDNKGGRKYAERKAALCDAVGMECRFFELPEDTTQEQLAQKVHDLSIDPTVHGVFLETPLPRHLSEIEALRTVPPEKDVEGMTFENVGRLSVGVPRFIPTTPAAVMKLLGHYGIQLAGQHAVVVGRSSIVGRPLSLLLLARDATVTICHSKTPNLADHCRAADIIVAAAGKPRLITGRMVREGAVVVDVGTNYLPSGLTGDVDFDEVATKAAWISPVPGGVGPVTTAMILKNVLRSALRQVGRD